MQQIRLTPNTYTYPLPADGLDHRRCEYFGCRCDRSFVFSVNHGSEQTSWFARLIARFPHQRIVFFNDNVSWVSYPRTPCTLCRLRLRCRFRRLVFRWLLATHPCGKLFLPFLRFFLRQLDFLSGQPPTADGV